MKTNIEILTEVESELNRFREKLTLAIAEQQKNEIRPSKKFAAAKRAALDLKNELTKLTQCSKYKWSR